MTATSSLSCPTRNKRKQAALGSSQRATRWKWRIKRRTAADQNPSLLPEAGALNEMLLSRLSQGERVATVNLPDPEDCHVVAAGIAAGASIILTGIRDFPAKGLKKFSLRKQTPTLSLPTSMIKART
jgi:hypothetical protein